MPTQKPRIQYEVELEPNSKQIGIYNGVEYELENTTNVKRYFCVFGPDQHSISIELAEQKEGEHE